MIAGAVIFLAFAMVFSAFIIVSVRIFQVNPDFVKKILRYSLIFLFTAIFLKPLYGNTSLTAHTNNELTSVHIQTSILEYFLIIEALEKVTHCVEFPWQAL